MMIGGYGQDGFLMRDPYFDGIKNKESFDMEKHGKGSSNDRVEAKVNASKTDNRIIVTPEEISQITGLGNKINLYI